MKVYSPTMLLETVRPCKGRPWSPELGREFRERLEKAGYPVLDVKYERESGIEPGGCVTIRLVEVDPITHDHWIMFIPVRPSEAHVSSEERRP